MAYLTGLNGKITMPSGYNAKLNTWSATLSRAVSDMTAFEDTGKRRQLGIMDMTGSAAGHLLSDVSSSDPGLTRMEANTDATGAALVLYCFSTSSTISATCVVDSIALSYDANADATVSFNFQLSGGVVPDATWDESA